MPELSHDTAEDGFHEIQLSGKQLVFLFMVTTSVLVVVFLCGVLVGRGARDAGAADARDHRRGGPGASAGRPTPARQLVPRPPSRRRRRRNARRPQLSQAAARDRGRRPRRSSRRRRHRRPRRHRRCARPRRRPPAQPAARPPGHLGRAGDCDAGPVGRERGREAPRRQGLPGLPRRIPPPAPRNRSSRCRSAATTTGARPSRCRAASRRKSSSSPGFRASPPLGRAARAQLPEIRPSRVRLDRADAARRSRPCARRALRRAPRVLSSACSSGVVYFAGTLYWLVETMTTFGGLADADRACSRRRCSSPTWRCFPAAFAVILAAPASRAGRAVAGAGPRRSGSRPSSGGSTSGTAFPGCCSATAR